MAGVTLHDLLSNPEKYLNDKAIQKKLEEIRKDKGRLNKITETYNSKYEKEVAEGTEKRKLLIEDGKRRGKKEEDVLVEYGKFLPSIQTPLLNFLFFFMRDNHDADTEVLREQYEKQYGHLREEYSQENRTSNNISDSMKGFSDEEDLTELKYEQQPEFTKEMLYGNMSHDMYAKIKKLKALSTSDNEHEAFEAYRSCLKLCQKFNIEFDKVPLDVERK